MINEEDIKKNAGSISKVEEAIERVEREISDLQLEIRKAEQKLDEVTAEKDIDYWRRKEERLRDEKKRLQDEKKQLRRKEERLRDEKKRLQEQLKEIEAKTSGVGVQTREQEGKSRPPDTQNSYSSVKEMGGRDVREVKEEYRREHPDKDHAILSSIVDFTNSAISPFFSNNPKVWKKEKAKVEKLAKAFREQAERKAQELVVLQSIKTQLASEQPAPTTMPDAIRKGYIDGLQKVFLRTPPDDLSLVGLSLKESKKDDEEYAAEVVIHFLRALTSPNNPLQNVGSERTGDTLATAPLIDFLLMRLENMRLYRGEKRSRSTKRRMEEQMEEGSRAPVGKGIDLLVSHKNDEEVEVFFLESKLREDAASKDILKLQKELVSAWKHTWNRCYEGRSGAMVNEHIVYGAQTIGTQRIIFYALDVHYLDAYRFYCLGEVTLPTILAEFAMLHTALGSCIHLRDLLRIQHDHTLEFKVRPRLIRNSGVANLDNAAPSPKAKGKDAKKSHPPSHSSSGSKTSGGSGSRSRNTKSKPIWGYPCVDDNSYIRGRVSMIYFSAMENGREVVAKDFQGDDWKKELRALQIANAANLPHVVKLVDCFIPDDDARNEGNLFSRSLTTDAVLVFPRLEDAKIDHLRKPLKEKLELFRQLMVGLKGLHKFHIIHMDLKPENLMIDPNNGGELVLTDFDLSEWHPEIDRYETMARCWSGTEGYVAPETDRDGIFGVKSDIYSAGMILLRILTPHLPGAANLNMETLLNWTWSIRGIDELMTFLRDFISSSLSSSSKKDDGQIRWLRAGAELVLQMTDKDPARRPTSQQVPQHDFFKGIKKHPQGYKGTKKTKRIV